MSTAGRPGIWHTLCVGGTVAITKATQTFTYAMDLVSTNTADLESYEIVIRRECLDDEYIDGMLRARGMDEKQICEAKSKVRAYLDLLLRDKGVDMTDDAYDALVNMAIHLIDESSKAV